MARELGTFNFSANFEVKKEGTIDARQSVDNFSDLLAFTSDNFIPQAFFVSVKGISDPAELGLYLCVDKDDLSNPLSWQKVGDGETLTAAEIVTLLESLEGTARLDASAIKNLVETIDSLLGNTDWRTGGEDNLGASNGVQVVETSPGIFEYQFQGNFNSQSVNSFGLFTEFIRDEFGVSINAYNSDFDYTSLFIQPSGFNIAHFEDVNTITPLVNWDFGIQPTLTDNRIGSLKKGISYKGFGESDETGINADYSSIPGIGLTPRKLVEDLIAEGTSNGLFPPVADITELKSLNTSNSIDYPDKWLIHVESLGVYALDRQSTATGDNNLVITPNVGNGRWIKKTVGDMVKSVYDPQNIAQDAFDRANMTGEQAITTITGLQDELDSKVNLTGDSVSTNFSIKTDTTANQGVGLVLLKNASDDFAFLGNLINGPGLIVDQTGSVAGTLGIFIDSSDGLRYFDEPSNILPTTLISKAHGDSTYIPKYLEDKIITASTYTILEEDLTKNLIFTNPCTITLPNALLKGFQFQIRKDTTGNLTFNAEGTLSSTEGNVFTGEEGTHGFIYKDDATTWVAILPSVGGVGSTTFEALTDTFSYTGNALELVRVNATEDALEPVPVSEIQSAPFIQTFTYTSGAQEFTLNETPGFVARVTRNGQVLQNPSLDYSVTGAVLTVNETLTSGDEIGVFYFTNVGDLVNTGGGGLQSTDIDTLAKLNAIVTDATLIDQSALDSKENLLTVSNGLIKDGSNNLKLGGSLTASTTIETQGNLFAFGTFLTTNDHYFVNSSSQNQLVSETNGTSKKSLVTTNINTSSISHLDVSGSLVSMVFSDSGIVVNDLINSQGIRYAGDYESNFISSSLVTKQFVENLSVNVDKGAGFIEVEDHVIFTSTATTGAENLVLSIPVPENNSISLNLKNFLITATDGTTQGGNGYSQFSRRAGENIREIGTELVNTNTETDATITIRPNTTANTVEVVFTNDTVTGKVFKIRLSYNYILDTL